MLLLGKIEVLCKEYELLKELFDVVLEYEKYVIVKINELVEVIFVVKDYLIFNFL